MQVVKKINNNVAVCIDRNNRELIAFGKGIGFPKTPYILNDLSKIQRTYYGINKNYLPLLHEIPEDIFYISSKIIDYAKTKISEQLNPNIVFTLADHINFAIERYKKSIKINMPLYNDIQYLYEVEMEIAKKSINYINRVKSIHLENDEAAAIAMHIINAKKVCSNTDLETNDEKIICDILNIIENHFNITINRSGFNYSRFISHMHYLLKRKYEDINVNSENKKIFESMKTEFQQTYICVQAICNYLKSSLKWNPGEEELLYLMLHINRLCSREDCNQ